MDCSTGVEPADQSCLGKIYQCGGNRKIPRFRPTALDIAQAPPRLLLRIFRAVANHTDFISGRFLDEKTYLVGY
jgi:hypothetical protein